MSHLVGGVVDRTPKLHPRGRSLLEKGFFENSDPGLQIGESAIENQK